MTARAFTLPSWSTRPRLKPHAIAVAAFLSSAVCAGLAAESGRPITTAIVFLFGVTLVGAVEGVRGGLVGAVVASLIYNFFLSDPVYRFSLTSAEELVPLLAFNAGAIASGIVAGRLRDRAIMAEVARQRIHLLLEVSERLQRSTKLADIEAGLRESAADLLQHVELYAVRGETLHPVGETRYSGVAEDMIRKDLPTRSLGACQAFNLSSAEGTTGVLVVEPQGRLDQSPVVTDLEALANLTNIAFQRCLALEQLAEADLIKKSEEFKTTMLSAVSHDFRTPLSAITAAASSLRSYGDDLSDEIQSDLITIIEEQTRRLDRYTANLLSLSRLQAGVDAAALKPCDVLEPLGTAITHVRAANAHVSLHKDFAISEAIVCADPVMLEQVFQNVLDNAAKFSPPQAPIKVSASLSGDVVKIKVSDSGAGIPLDERDRIFDRFYRSQSAHPVAGSGLGLSIAKGFTEVFGGSIFVEAAEGGGTAVTIRLPLYGSGTGK